MAGALLAVVNSQNHRECQSIIVDAFARHACRVIDLRYDGGIVAVVVGAVLVVSAVIGMSTDSARRR